MTRINWALINHFNQNEFSEDPDIYAHPDLLMALDKWRTDYGSKIIPSKAQGALARPEMASRTSYHYADPYSGVYSRAVDVFPQGSIPWAYLSALQQKAFGGIGIYFTKRDHRGADWPMIHVDIRKDQRVTWYWTQDEGYVYINKADNTSAVRWLLRLLDRYE